MANYSYIEAQRRSGFEVGDRVRLLRKAVNREAGWTDGWIEAMDQYVGKVGTIHSISSNSSGIRVDGLGCWNYPYFVLEKETMTCNDKMRQIYLEGHKKSGFSTGQRVRVMFKVPDHAGGWQAGWPKEMDDMVGKTYRIKSNNMQSGFQLETPGRYFSFPWFCLEAVPELDVKQELQKIINSTDDAAAALKNLVAQL